ncbi:MAG: MarR family transcriptional regulator, partial [Nitrososphaerales archaeon]
ISKDLVDTILNYTKCHPYYTQQLCYYVWENSNAKIAAENIAIAIKTIIQHQSVPYSSLCDTLTAVQKKVLHVIGVEGATEIFSKDIAKKYDLSPSSMQRALDSLESKELILKNAEYWIDDPFFIQWVKDKLR